jgi:TRAP-type C4-dicarboxylate transport system permease small subunit
MKRILEYINAALLFVIFASVMTQVLGRGVLKIPVPWTDEATRYTYVVLVFLGAALALRDTEGSHITVDIVTMLLPTKIKKILRIASNVCMLFFVVTMTAGALQNTKWTWKSSLATISWVSLGYIYIAIALSGVLMIVYIILNIIDDIRGFIKAERSS